MKNLIYQFQCVFLFCLSHILYSQPQTRCFEPPTVDFDHPAVLFGYVLEDTTITDRCQGIVFDRHRGLTRLKPTDYDDMYIISMGSYSGTILLGVEKENHSIKWQNFYNHLNTEHRRGLIVGNFRKRGGDSLEMLTYRTFGNFSQNQLNLRGGGFGGRRTIDYHSGALLQDYWVGDSLGVQEETDSRLGFFTTHLKPGKYPVAIGGSDMYYNNLIFRNAADSTCFIIRHQYTDTSTLIAYNQRFPHFDLQGIAAPDLFVRCDQPSNVSPNVFDLEGPFSLSQSGNTYFLKYLQNNKKVFRKLILDDWGNLLSDEDITTKTGSEFEEFYFYTVMVQKNDSTMIIRGGVPDTQEFWGIGHQGYLEIHENGQILKNRKQLVFDDLRPMLHNMCVIPQRNSLLHVFRPQENNDLYFYEEFEDGTYRQAGHLVNRNDAFYAFYPENVWLMENGDVFVHLNGILDSVWGESGINNFNLGGWHAMIRVDGQALGITTSTKDVGSNVERSTIYPNPAATDIRIQTTRPVYPLTGEIINQLGQIVRTFDMQDDQQAIDVSALPSGMYFVRSYDPKTRLNVSIGKWMKE